MCLFHIYIGVKNVINGKQTLRMNGGVKDTNMRTQMLIELSNGWREAENHFLKTGDDSWKTQMEQIGQIMELTSEEKEELDKMNTASGV